MGKGRDHSAGLSMIAYRCKHLKSPPGDGGVVDGCGWQGPLHVAVCPSCGSRRIRPVQVVDQATWPTFDSTRGRLRVQLRDRRCYWPHDDATVADIVAALKAAPPEVRLAVLEQLHEWAEVLHEATRLGRELEAQQAERGHVVAELHHQLGKAQGEADGHRLVRQGLQQALLAAEAERDALARRVDELESAAGRRSKLS